MNEDDFIDHRGEEPGRRVHDYLEKQLCAAMAKAMREVITDPEVISAVGAIASDMLQRRAREGAGGLVLGAIRALLSRWLLIGLIVLAVAQLVGWPAAIKAVIPAAKGQP